MAATAERGGLSWRSHSGPWVFAGWLVRHGPWRLPRRLLVNSLIEGTARGAEIFDILDDPGPDGRHPDQQTQAQRRQFVFDPGRDFVEVVPQQQAVTFEGAQGLGQQPLGDARTLSRQFGMPLDGLDSQRMQCAQRLAHGTGSSAT